MVLYSPNGFSINMINWS